jgi:hypothetical protein
MDDFIAAGWMDDFVSRRAWLDFSARLRRSIKRSPARTWGALSICELDLVASKEPAIDVQNALGRLRISVPGYFPATQVQEHYDGQTVAVTFEISNHSYRLPVSTVGRANIYSLLAVANAALENLSATRRFHPLAEERGCLLIAFARPATIRTSLQQGLCPSTALPSTTDTVTH